jgi:cytochrome c-type biogenesis protein CcmH/NrfG
LLELREEAEMSFPIVCPNCGAPSGPSTGVCPFCKTAVVSAAGEGPRGGAAVKKAYEAGDLPLSLSLCASVAADDPKAMEDPDFLLTYARILIESEGPSSKIKSLLGRAYSLQPENPAVSEYLEIVDAKSQLTPEKNDLGEKKLSEILRRSPNNVHALFLLGAHLFWVSREPGPSIRYLERCVSLRPNFLRAWGCLGSVYESLGNRSLSANAYRRCVSLERDPEMRSFFEKKAASSAG